MSRDNFYRAFEERYRGSQEVIKERLKVYLPFVLPLKNLYEDGLALDIGCGRGEWLSLMQEHGIPAVGIDFDEGMLEACKQQGLNVEQGDGIAYLKSQANESLVVITAFHVVEHISFEQLQELIHEAHRVLKSGGLLILETPNPENIRVASELFYLDPTHMKPIPSMLLSFLPEFHGFERTKVLRLQAQQALATQCQVSVKDVIEGASPDYAVVTQKGAPKQIIKQFDEVFAQEFGLSFDVLTAMFECRLAKIEGKLEQAEEKIDEMLNSVSWKITKPVRLIQMLIRTLKSPKQALKKTLLFVDKQTMNVIAKIAKRRSLSLTDPEGKRHTRRMFVDCSFIHGTNLNTGIQRVVRNTLKHMDNYAIEKGFEIVPVVLMEGMFIHVDMNKNSDKSSENASGLLGRIRARLRKYALLYKRRVYVCKGDILLMLDSTWHLDVWPSVAYAKKEGALVIGVAYDLIPISHPHFCDETLVRLFTEWYEKSIVYFDGYIAISQTVMKDVQAYVELKGHSVQDYAFDYFHLGSDFELGKLEATNVREEIKSIYASEKPVYLIVSTIEPRKNHRYLLQTFNELWSRGVDVSLLMVGRVGWKTEDLIREIREHSEYQNRLWLFSDLSDCELHYCYHQSKALVFPSFIEGYGLPIIESIQSGLPVLASDIPVHREVGQDNIGYFDIHSPLALADKIQSIEYGEEELIKADKENFRIFSWEDSSHELFDKATSFLHFR